VETSQQQPGLLLDLAVGLYLLGIGVAVVFSYGWWTAVSLEGNPETTHELVPLGLALSALTAAAVMARAVWANKASRARGPLFVSLVFLAIWAIAFPPIG
jgi:hypothetical protein